MTSRQWNEMWYQIVLGVFRSLVLTIFLFSIADALQPGIVSWFVDQRVVFSVSIIAGLVLFGLSLLPRQPLEPSRKDEKRSRGTLVFVAVLSLVNGGFIFLETKTFGIYGMALSLVVTIMVFALLLKSAGYSRDRQDDPLPEDVPRE